MQAPKYQSLKDHVYEYIAQKIQDGTLLPNQKVNEAEICKKLDISRTPTREALFQLSSDNLLDYLPRRGFTVKAFDPKKKLDFSRIIGVLDALAATLCIEQLSDSDMKAMEGIVDKIDLDISHQHFLDYYMDQYNFHDIYIKKCDNPVLIETLNSLKNSFIRQSYASEDKQKLADVLKEVNAEHRKILELFRSKDKEALECTLKHHWRIIDTEML
ncbi:DNA-binding GntR family transcriptional regulator [Paenibacillus endophyticus]|uniref:DNA-binding GntR family transcriptional regulator n=1 Tax=Paenibacillus endophyticus TaxID=1294268 RepID=A0A7W5GAP1_9BACL|nr:GntR family transcriptional regulator [Paenibacillus endophyticus]MBB3153444.1 DNA-binding GntR family transcriptional regulator [Paenibacillus endophyticus]